MQEAIDKLSEVTLAVGVLAAKTCRLAGFDEATTKKLMTDMLVEPREDGSVLTRETLASMLTLAVILLDKQDDDLDRLRK